MKLQVNTISTVARHEEHECTCDVEPDVAVELYELWKKYKGKDIFQIDSEEDRELLLSCVTTGEYPVYCYIDYIGFQQYEDVKPEDLPKLVVEKHNQQVEQTLTKLD